MTYSGSDTTTTTTATSDSVAAVNSETIFADNKEVIVYKSFDDAPDPSVMNANMESAALLGKQLEYQVHPDNSTRKWKWDTKKWTLFGDTTLVGGIEFDAEIPIYQDLKETDGDGMSVTHFFDMKDLKPLK